MWCLPAMSTSVLNQWPTVLNYKKNVIMWNLMPQSLQSAYMPNVNESLTCHLDRGWLAPGQIYALCSLSTSCHIKQAEETAWKAVTVTNGL